jgi:pimeloyl-ACP methyl ester carboxylesterase
MPAEFDVPVAGGTLRVADWPGDGPLVIAAHGITANALSWARVARALKGRVRLIAPDLRGRARSAKLPGPYGMAQHAADLMAIADFLGVRRVGLVGHSMGGFVVTETAQRYAGRVSSVLLVDGGVPLAIPDGMDVDAALAHTIGPAMKRLAMTFPTLDAYIAFFEANPAMGRYWSAEMGRYIERDYVEGRSSCEVAAIRADAADMMKNPAPHAHHPILWAPRGMQDEDQGMYAAAQLDDMDATLVADVNHYTIVLGAGAARVADKIAGTAGN